MTGIERILYAHLRFVFRRLDVDLHKDSVKEIAHAIMAFFETNGLMVGNRKSIMTALSWAQEAVADLPPEAAPLPQYLPGIEAELEALAEAVGSRPVPCDDMNCQYHNLANQQPVVEVDV